MKKTVVTLVVLLVASIALVGYSSRKDIFYRFLESRTHEYLHRGKNSPQLEKEAAALVAPAFAIWRKGGLAQDDVKLLGQTWIDLKNNVPEAIGGKPLTDAEFRSRILRVKALVRRKGMESASP